MDKELIDSIKLMVPEGNILKLPKTQISNYPALKKCLLTAGGTYKRSAFVFDEDAAEVQARLIGGEAINDKKKFQFFPTPPELAQRLVDLAEVNGHIVLEPSAGQGAIADLLDNPVVVELMPQNVKALERKGYCNVIEGDFLKMDDLGEYDRIIANPPFTNRQDIDHIMHMWSMLKPGGRIVAVTMPSWKSGNMKKQLEFRQFLHGQDHQCIDLEAGEFKSSGTTIATSILVINKAA